MYQNEFKLQFDRFETIGRQRNFRFSEWLVEMEENYRMLPIINDVLHLMVKAYRPEIADGEEN